MKQPTDTDRKVYYVTFINKAGLICLRQIMEDLIITEYVEGRRNKTRKTENPSLSFKEMLLGIPGNSISVKEEKAQSSTDIC